MCSSLEDMLIRIFDMNDETFICNKDYVKSFLDITSEMYENDNSSPISDADWDKVQIKYSRLIEPYSFGAVINVGGLVDTEHFMNDISGIDNKITSEDELVEFMNGIPCQSIRTIRHSKKYDGMSIMLELDVQTLKIKKALTRGKLGKGVDFTKVFFNKSIGTETEDLLKQVRTDVQKICLRAEVIMTDQTFKKYILDTGVQYKDKRSCVAGLMKKALFGNILDVSDYIVLKPFLVEIDDVSDVALSYRILFPNNNLYIGKIYPEEEVCYEGFVNQIQYTESILRDKLSYEIDGVVYYLFDENDNVIDRFAYKFQAFTVETELLNIEYDFSPKTGILTPMGCIDVTYNGREFKRVSLANIGRVRRENFTVGSKVRFTYRGDVMGYLDLIQTDETGVNLMPTTCPHCSESLSIQINEFKEETFLKCTNTSCLGKKAGLILNHLQKLDIKGIDINTVQQIVDGLEITSLTDLYKIKFKDLLKLDGIKDRKALIIIDAIRSKEEIFDYEILGSLNIKNVGLTTAEIILKQISIVELVALIESNRDSAINFLVGIQGIENTIATYLVDGIKNNIDDLTYLLFFVYEGYKEVRKNIKVGGLSESNTFVVTGSVNLFTNRNELTKYIKSYGHKVVDSVSSNTDYLVNNDIHSNSSKNKKAKELNIPILTEEDMIKLIEGE